MSLTLKDFEELKATKVALLKDFFTAEPPQMKGEELLELWRQIYDHSVRSTVLETATGESSLENPVRFGGEKSS